MGRSPPSPGVVTVCQGNLYVFEKSFDNNQTAAIMLPQSINPNQAANGNV